MIKEFVIMVIGVSALCYGASILDEKACMEKSVSFSDSKYTILSGCMVKHKGKWLPLDNIRGFDGE